MENIPATGDIPIEKESKGNPWKKVWIALGVLLVVVLGVSVYECFRITPYDVRFTNVTSSSVTVSWNTKSPTSATAMAFKGDTSFPLTVFGLGGERFYDTRDVRVAELNAASNSGTNRDDLSLTMDDFQTEIVIEDMGEYYTHHVTITGLESETMYSFMVGDEYLFRKVGDVNGNVVVSTLQIPEEIKSPVPAYGTVKNAEGSYDKPVDQLAPLSDAIVYLNYYDEVTGERSSVYSSSVTEDGNWYIDVSMAMDSSGQPFLVAYGGVDSEIFVDLVVDAGEYGIWDTRTEDLSISPAKPLVVNFPEKVNVIDVQNPLEKQGGEFGLLSNLFVQAVLAAKPAEDTPSGCETNACQFVDYCGPCQRQCADGYWYSCDCPEATLTARNCTGGDSNPENPITCGGIALDTHEKVGSDCKVCSKVAQNGYYVGRWVTDNEKYDPAKNCKERSTCTPQTCAQVSNGNYVHVSRSACEAGGYTCSSKDFYDDCVGTLTCWKRDKDEPEEPLNNGCPNGDCGGGETFSNCPGDCYRNVTCRGGKIGDDCFVSGQWGTGEVGACDSMGSCVCVSKSCTQLVRETAYNLDDAYNQDNPPSGEANPLGSLIKDNCGKDKVCYKEYSVGESGTPVPKPVETPSPKPIETPSPGNIEVQNNIQLEVHLEIPAGTQCSEQDPLGNKVGFCSCKGGVDSIRYPGEWCRQTKLSPTPTNLLDREWRFCSEGSQEGDVCWKNGNTCKNGVDPEWNESGLYCNGAPPSSLNFPKKDSMELFSSNKYVKGVYAQEQEIQYLLDSETGMFVNLPLGVYVVEYDGSTYSVQVDKSGEGVQTLLYIDTNENGQYDEGVDKNLGEDAAVLNISPVELVYNYSLKEGFNFVTFPFLIQTDYDVSSTAALLLELNERYDNAIYSISKYDGRWKIVGQNTELYDANDFQLLPGQGYVIKAKEDVSITLTGQPVKYDSATDTAPITLFEGWNLIGLYGTGVKTYTASSMITDINTSNFTADNVTKWASDKQMYEGFQSSEGGEYGFDFPINSLESYFVRILEGRGNWQPKLRTQ